MIELRGAYTALVTPFTEEGRDVDVARLTGNINAQSVAGISGVVPCGTTGETPTLTEKEYRLVIERTIDAARPLNLTTIAGAGSNSTAHAVTQHRFVHDAGADAALHVTPYYNRPSAEGLYRHFMTVADACPLPVVLYNVPGRTGVGLSIDTIERLAAHPNIVAIKEASGSLELTTLFVERTGLTVLSGDDPMTLSLALAGASGVISVLANVRPDQGAALCDAFARGDWETARAINTRLLPLGRALLSVDSNPVPVKLALRLLGRDSGAVRLPLCPAPEPAAKRLRKLIADLEPEVAGVPV